MLRYHLGPFLIIMLCFVGYRARIRVRIRDAFRGVARGRDMNACPSVVVCTFFY